MTAPRLRRKRTPARTPRRAAPKANPAEAMLQKMMAAGWSPTTLSKALEIPLAELLAIDPIRGRRARPEDEELAAGIRSVAWRAIVEAMRIFDEGDVRSKQALTVRLLMPLTRAMAGEGGGDDLSEVRDSLTKIFDELRGSTRGIRPDAAGAAADDPDEGGDD